mmetsp:Transcript_29208/g.60852  ORF Transcript_29208/g.60852 Transcript_29208/m.60852 type:complete len:218 (+) Transcript_29208:779-1432(+)
MSLRGTSLDAILHERALHFVGCGIARGHCFQDGIGQEGQTWQGRRQGGDHRRDPQEGQARRTLQEIQGFVYGPSGRLEVLRASHAEHAPDHAGQSPPRLVSGSGIDDIHQGWEHEGEGRQDQVPMQAVRAAEAESHLSVPVFAGAEHRHHGVPRRECLRVQRARAFGPGIERDEQLYESVESGYLHGESSDWRSVIVWQPSSANASAPPTPSSWRAV